MEKLIITAAVCGGAPRKETKSRRTLFAGGNRRRSAKKLPRGPALSMCTSATPQTGRPAFERELFSEVVDRVGPKAT
jgi:hypothetical protein